MTSIPPVRVALATCATLPEPDIDEAPLLEAFRAAGAEAETLAWDDPAVDPAAFDAICLRATWNYPERAEEFLAWLDRAAGVSRLFNPPAIVRANIDKRYLRDLASKGIPIIPTAFAGPGDTADLASLCDRRKWTDIVIKPAVGAGSFLTERFGEADRAEAQAFLDKHAADRAMLIQRFMPSVATAGERAVVTIDGKVSHAVHKHPRFAADDEKVEGVALADDERVFAERVLELLGDEPLYARVDLIRDDDGSLLLSELEMIEPSLFFPFDDDAARTFAEATLARVSQPAQARG